MKLYKITDDKIDLLKTAETPLALLFSSQGCHLCVGLKPIYRTVAADYKEQFDFAITNIDMCPQIKEKFVEEGVPTICVVAEGVAYYVPDPQEPEKHTWYSADYIKKQLDAFIEGEFYSWNARMI